VVLVRQGGVIRAQRCHIVPERVDIVQLLRVQLDRVKLSRCGVELREVRAARKQSTSQVTQRQPPTKLLV